MFPLISSKKFVVIFIKFLQVSFEIFSPLFCCQFPPNFFKKFFRHFWYFKLFFFLNFRLVLLTFGPINFLALSLCKCNFSGFSANLFRNFPKFSNIIQYFLLIFKAIQKKNPDCISLSFWQFFPLSNDYSPFFL